MNVQRCCWRSDNQMSAPERSCPCAGLREVVCLALGPVSAISAMVRGSAAHSTTHGCTTGHHHPGSPLGLGGGQGVSVRCHVV